MIINWQAVMQQANNYVMAHNNTLLNHNLT